MKARRRKKRDQADPFPDSISIPAAAPAPGPKKQHGGRRVGAGRKPSGAKAMSAGIYIRCSEEQKGALAAFVDAMNTDRIKSGFSKVELSTWIRELALKHAGREDLGLAAAARRRAAAADSIV